MNVQHVSDDDSDIPDNGYETIMCPACSGLHFLNRKTGKVLGQPPLAKEPICVKCGGQMRFSCIEEEKPGFLHHVYECTKCRSTQSFVTPK
jgi:hypothetical protein